MKKFFIAAAVILTAIVAGSIDTRAQIQVPAGDEIVCVLRCHGLIFIRFADGTVIELPGDAEGEATLESLGPDPDHAVGTEFKIVSLDVSGNSPQVGAFNFTLDASRPATNSTVYATDEAVEAGVEFPAVGDVYANVTGTIESLAGTFTNVNECHMQNTNLQSFNPHNSEVYTFVNDVEFIDDDPDGDGVHVTFTIPAGASVTLD